MQRVRVICSLFAPHVMLDTLPGFSLLERTTSSGACTTPPPPPSTESTPHHRPLTCPQTSLCVTQRIPRVAQLTLIVPHRHVELYRTTRATAVKENENANPRLTRASTRTKTLSPVPQGSRVPSAGSPEPRRITSQVIRNSRLEAGHPCGQAKTRSIGARLPFE